MATVSQFRKIYIAVILAVAGVLSIGFAVYPFYWSNLSDVRERWVEMRYVWSGHNPFDAALGHAPPLPSLRVPPYPAYPPWAFTLGRLFLLPEGWSNVRVYYLVVNLVCLLGLGAWLYRLAPRRTVIDRLLPVLVFFAFASVQTSLAVGQYSLIVVGCLCAAYYCGERNRPVAAGCFLAMAMVKPTLGLPFLLPMFLRRRYRALLSCAVILALASGLTWWLVRTDPVTMLLQAAHFGRLMFFAGSGWLKLLSGFSAAVLIPVVGVGVLILGYFILKGHAMRPMLTSFAAAAVIARLFTYHRHYDDLILFFLLAEEIRENAESGAPFAVSPVLLIALSLCLPPRYLGLPYQLFQCVVWIVLLLRCWRRAGRPAVSSSGDVLTAP